MAHGHNRYQFCENRAKVRQVLMEAWDPIGVRGIAEARDEYDMYVDQVYVMLVYQRATRREIETYLHEIATHHMGLSYPELATLGAEAADLLVGLR
ncbi:MAG: hypothetical protein ACREF1_04430 [Acetobacteraceae bacterium]